MKAQEILRKLLQIQSFSFEEKEVSQFIFDFATDHKLPVEWQGENVVVSFITGASKCLVFNGHMDTVKAGNVSLWKHPPVGPDAGQIDDGKMFGLGASDMKASLAAYLELALFYRDNSPPIDVFFVFVTREEVDGYGSKMFVEYFESNHRDRYEEVVAILGEPTDFSFTEIGHRGSAYVKMTVEGNSGHGARPEEIEKHAIESLMQEVVAFQESIPKLADEFEDPVLGKPTFTLTGIEHPEVAPNQVPHCCSAIWDVRFTPVMQGKILDIFREQVSTECALEPLSDTPGYSLNLSQQNIVNILEKVIPECQPRLARGSNDGVFFSEVGIPALTFGPGLKRVMHRENEYVPLAHLEQAASTYGKIVNEFSCHS